LRFYSFAGVGDAGVCVGNQQSISLMFLGWAGPQLPVSLVIVLALLFGMLVGPVLGWFLGRSSRAARKRLV